MTLAHRNRHNRTMRTSVKEKRQKDKIAFFADLSEKDKAEMVTVDYILAKFVECVEGVGVFEGIKPTQVIRALERLGDFKKMFVQRAALDVNFLALLREAPMQQLEKIQDAELVGERDTEIPRLTPGSGSKSGLQSVPSRSGRIDTR